MAQTRKNTTDGVTVTVKLTCYKDIVLAAEYSKNFSGSDQSVIKNVNSHQ